jgi:hypothetical protein
MTVIDGELWTMVEDGEPEKTPPANPAIIEAVAAMGPGWHYGRVERESLYNRLGKRLGLPYRLPKNER